MATVLITGASGFVGQAVSRHFSKKHKIVMLDKSGFPSAGHSTIRMKGCVSDIKLLKTICQNYRPDIVIHCAGIAHQKIISKTGSDVYDKINCVATESVARESVKNNPEVHFIFLSSISVYGENLNFVVREDDECYPTSVYAVSKLNAEKRLKKLYDDDVLNKLDILRLSPLYDKHWTVNLDKRVLFPGKLFYSKFGNGNQKMSILSRQNLVDFIDLIIVRNNSGQFCNIFNVSDQAPCSFDEIIRIFRKSKCRPNRKVLQVPLGLVKVLTNIAGLVFRNKSKLLNSSYRKLANDLVFDNQRMLEKGFKPKHSIETVFKNENN